MSNKRYLEIDSNYRNRNQWPQPSNFEVLIAQSGTRDAARAFDPVSDAAPFKTWVPDDLVLTDASVFASHSVNTPSEFVMCVPATGSVSRTPNYYAGYPIEKTNPPVETVKIVSWSFLSSNGESDCFNVAVEPAFSGVPTGPINFSPSADVNDFKIGSVFAPDGFDADHFYVDFILYNETVARAATGSVNNNWRTITSYNGSNKLLGLDLTPGLIDPAVPSTDTWKTTDKLTIRKAPPQYVGRLASTIAPQPENTSTSFTVPADTIVRVGDFIRFTGVNYNGLSCRVVSYTGKGKPANPNTNPPTPEIYAYIVTVNSVLDPVPDIETFEVLQFTRDNAVPFCYSGSLVSQQEMVCYEIELLNLVLPNITLQSGGRTAFYPYVYVELQNVSGASAGTKSVIYSNNPNSTRMLFRAAIDDIPNPVASPFIKIDGDGMVQTVKFKPNDNFKFGVYLPNGDPLETVEQDLLSPSTPNPLVQVSAVFSIRRL